MDRIRSITPNIKLSPGWEEGRDGGRGRRELEGTEEREDGREEGGRGTLSLYRLEG